MPLYHLSFKSHVDDWKKKIADLTKKIINLQCGGLNTQCNIVLEEMSELAKQLEEEVSSRDYFRANYERIYNEVNEVEKMFLRICALLPEVKQYYLISDEETSKIDELSVSVNNLGSSKRYLDGFVHSGTRQPFSLLKSKLDELEQNYLVVNEGVMSFKNFVDSLKATAEEAYNMISVYYRHIKDTENLLLEIGNEEIAKNYQEKIDAVYDVLNDIYEQVQSRPINVTEVTNKIENLKNIANAMFEEIDSLYRNQQIAETNLVILNQDRTEQDINQVATALEMSFDKGDFVSVNSQAVSVYKNRHTVNEQQ